jgi:hypothetical protein
LAGWLDTAARRAAIAIRKKESRRAAVEAAVPTRDGGEDVTQPREVSEAVRAAVADLPDRYRLPITYRYLVGLPPGDVARVLGVPEDTGKTRLKRGLQLLRDKLGGKGLGIGVAATTGTVSLESALSAAAERVPDGVLVATLDAVRALPVKRSLLAAAMGVVTFRRAMIAGWTLAAGMATAFVLMPDSKSRQNRLSTNSTEKGISMRGSSTLAVLAALGMTPTAKAQVFTKIADTSTPVPGGSGNFSMLTSTQIQISDSRVLFYHTSAAGTGAYSASISGGPISVVADTHTPIPNGTGNFTSIYPILSISESGYGFVGVGDGVQGVYVQDASNSLLRIADQSTPIPNGSGNFTALNRVYLSGQNAYFSQTNQGIYGRLISGGPISTLYDSTTFVPGGFGNISSFSVFGVSGSRIAFGGSNGSNAAVFSGTITGDPLVRLADTSTIIPNGHPFREELARSEVSMRVLLGIKKSRS